MADHTPGPWEVVDRTEIGALLDTPDAVIVADTMLMHGEPSRQQMADARLIATAPDMLALLESLHADLARYAKLAEEVWSSGSIAFDSMASECSRLIAKAKGA